MHLLREPDGETKREQANGKKDYAGPELADIALCMGEPRLDDLNVETSVALCTVCAFFDFHDTNLRS